VGAGLVDFVIAFGLFGRDDGLLHRFSETWRTGWIDLALAAIPNAGHAGRGTSAPGSLLAALTVAYRDFRHAVPFVMQVGCCHAEHCICRRAPLAASNWAFGLAAEPGFRFVQNFRLALLDRPLDLYSLAISGVVSIGLLFWGCFYFRRRVEHHFGGHHLICWGDVRS